MSNELFQPKTDASNPNMQEVKVLKDQNQNSNAARVQPKTTQNGRGRRPGGERHFNAKATPTQKASRVILSLTPKVVEKKVMVVEPKRNTCHYISAHRDEIFKFLKSKESISKQTNEIFANQTEVTPKMRAILIDWLVDISLRFKLLPETLFLAIGTIDRMLDAICIERDSLQLLGIASLFSAAKFEEIYPPLLKDFVSACANAYSKTDIVNMEGLILTTLNFDLSRPSSYSYLRIFNLQLNIDCKLFLFAQYLLESALLDTACFKYTHSVLAASGIFLVNKIFKRESWTQAHIDLTGESEEQVKRCAKDLYMALQRAEAGNLKATQRKFSHQEFLEVGKYKVHRAVNRS